MRRASRPLKALGHAAARLKANRPVRCRCARLPPGDLSAHHATDAGIRLLQRLYAAEGAGRHGADALPTDLLVLLEKAMLLRASRAARADVRHKAERPQQPLSPRCTAGSKRAKTFRKFRLMASTRHRESRCAHSHFSPHALQLAPAYLTSAVEHLRSSDDAAATERRMSHTVTTFGELPTTSRPMPTQHA